MVCLPTPARAAMASTLTLAYPLSRHSDSAASRMATRELSLRREASGFVVDVGTYLRVAEDETVRLVTRAHLRLHSRRVVSSCLMKGASDGHAAGASTRALPGSKPGACRDRAARRCTAFGAGRSEERRVGKECR